MYCSQADLEKRLDPQVLRALTDDDGDGLADTAVIDAAIADADALIDTYLRARYVVPLNPVPDAVRSISAAVAIYFLLTRRHEIVPAEHLKRYESAMQLLDHLSRGEISLNASQPTESPHLPQSSREADERTFDEESLENY
jgi:phage gp36-like protein